MTPGASPEPLRVGVSACLLGEPVRHDGGHKRFDFLTDALGPHVEWVPVCPEMEIGLGTPREPIHLVEVNGTIRLRTVESRIDLTEKMLDYVDGKVERLAAEDLAGFVLKSRSPSCGVTGVENGRGLFAAALVDHHGLLPVVEETDLADRESQELFVERLFASRRLGELFREEWTADTLAAFHQKHELQIIAHSSEWRKDLEKIVVRMGSHTDPRDMIRYADGFADALAVPPTRERHAGALRRAWNRLAPRVSRERGAALEQGIRAYEEGRSDRGTVRDALRDAAHEVRDGILTGQTYLEPDPRELAILAERVES